MQNNPLPWILLFSLTHCKLFKKDSKLESQTITSINNRFDDPLKQKETNIYMDQYPGGKKSDYFPLMCFYTSQAPLWWKNPNGKLEPAPYEMRNMAHLQSFKRFAPEKMPQIAPYVPIFELSKRMAAMADESTRDAKRAELAQQKLQIWHGFVHRMTANLFATFGFVSQQGARLVSEEEVRKMNIIRSGDLQRQSILSSMQLSEAELRKQQAIGNDATVRAMQMEKKGEVFLQGGSETDSSSVSAGGSAGIPGVAGITIGGSTSSATSVNIPPQLKGVDTKWEKVGTQIKIPNFIFNNRGGEKERVVEVDVFKGNADDNLKNYLGALDQAQQANKDIIQVLEDMKQPLAQLHDVAQKTASLIMNGQGQIIGGNNALLGMVVDPAFLIGAYVGTFAASTAADFVLSKKIGKKMTEKTNALLQREYVDIFSKAFNATQSQEKTVNNKPIKIDAYDVETIPILDQAVMAMVGAGSIDFTLSCPPRRLDPSTYQLVPNK